MIKTCYYNFPCHPSDMIQYSKNIPTQSILLRNHIIMIIAELSQHFPQYILDEKVFVDVDMYWNIIGMDVSALYVHNSNLCKGKRISIGNLNASDWINMKCF